MIKSSIVAIGLWSAALTHGAPPAASVAPLPAGRVALSPTSSRSLVLWTPGETRCEGGVVTASRMLRPWNSLGWAGADNLKPVTYGFTIDESGRPLSIARHGIAIASFTVEIAPALAASQFPAGIARKGCTITYTPAQQPLDAAPIGDLVSYTITPTGGPLPKQGWDRIRQGGTCADAPRPQPLVRVFPNFRELPSEPGVKDWALVAYDLDSSGKPKNVRLETGTGNSALNTASLKAIVQSRFTKGARTGCHYPFSKAPGKLLAPPPPEESSFRPANANCTGPRDWTTPLVLQFPQPYRRRMIEGWAVVSYDIAPWGETGNVKILASEPTEDFGNQAMQIIRRARVAPSPQGVTGCVDRVKFVMAPEGAAPVDDEPAPPLD